MKVADLFEAAFNHSDYDNADEWAEDFAGSIGSAFEMWMSDDQKQALWELARSGHKVKAKSMKIAPHDNSTDKHQKSIDKLHAFIDAQDAQGWNCHGYEINDGMADVVLVKATA